MSSSNYKVKRVEWIDCAKGIAMILVIFGHTVLNWGSPLEQVLRGIIFSFHMPLFFILSCVTFQFSTDNSQFIKKTEKAFRHLIFTAIIVYGVRILIDIIMNFRIIEWKSYIADKINILIYGSGVDVNISNAVIPAFGMMWFLLALFCGRTLFDYLHLKLNDIKFVVAILVCTIIGIAFGYIQWLPLSLDVALAIMPFFWFGNFLKKVDFSENRILWCAMSLIIWVVTFAVSYFMKNEYMELAIRRYSLFPLCYITAIAGTMFLSYFSQYMLELGSTAKPLVYIGRKSIYLYCVHAVDYVYGFLWNRTNSNVFNGIIRIIVDVILCMILVKAIEGFVALKRKKLCHS